MLLHLYIKNFALIDELDIGFNAGFSVITGETGAGKSIILGALGLLSGNRADLKAIKEGAGKCVVEAKFDVPGDAFHTLLAENDIDAFDAECIVRREINAAGKSRAFVNDTPVSLALLKEISGQLIDIHSQHQNLLLKDNSFQLSVVDAVAGSQQLLAQYSDSYKAYYEARSTLEKTRKETERSRQNIDFVRFQYEELSRLNLQEGEEEQLEKQSNIMGHAEEIKRVLYETDENFSDEQTGILVRLHRSLSSLGGITDVYPQIEETHNRLDAIYVELKDLSADISDLSGTVEYDPNEMERITNRLDAIYTMEKKHQVTGIAALLRLQESFKAEIDNSDNSEMLLEELEKKLSETKERCFNLSRQLSGQRRSAVGRIEKEICGRLSELGLPDVRFKVNIVEKEPSSDGMDAVEFLFSANPGMPLRAVSDVASGGETARVMLSLKAMLGGVAKLPAIIFDEIDTGVSGKVAEQMAITMKQMSEADRQVISITHLPQIAAYGRTHYKVYKQQCSGDTFSRMKQLTEDERVEEIAQMLSGNSISEAAVSNAKKLLGLS